MPLESKLIEKKDRLVTEGVNCPYCDYPFQPGHNVVFCPSCNTPHHVDCWKDNGNRCTIFGDLGAGEVVTPVTFSPATAGASVVPLIVIGGIVLFFAGALFSGIGSQFLFKPPPSQFIGGATSLAPSPLPTVDTQRTLEAIRVQETTVASSGRQTFAAVSEQQTLIALGATQTAIARQPSPLPPIINVVPKCIVTEDLSSLPTWTCTWDADWGGRANWSASGSLLATRSVPGSSARVKVYPVSPYSSYTIQVFMNGTPGGDYWTEAAYKLGSNSGQDFDDRVYTWVLINKFDGSGSFANGNGGTWTPYTSFVDTGSNTSISIGYKAGMRSGIYPGGHWKNLSMCQR